MSVKPLKRTVRRREPSNKSPAESFLVKPTLEATPFASLTLGVWVTLGVLSCGAPPARSPADGLPTFGPEHAALFDDGFSGHLFETAFVPGVAGDDTHFEDRVQAAESIWLLKVATVSREGSVGASRRYNLAFRTLGSVSGPPPREPVSLTVSAKDPAFHWLDRVGGAWVGHEVLLMVRRYRKGDHVVLHFHGEPNEADLRGRMEGIHARATAERAARAPKK